MMGLIPLISRLPGRDNARALLLLAAIAGLLSAASAVNYTVGDDNAWRRPADPTYFAQWAAQYTFTPADNLLFDNQGANTDVVVVEQADYQVCNVARPSTGPLELPMIIPLLDVPIGTYYITSSVPGDCAAGLKVAITVVASGTGGGAPAPAASPPPLATPPATAPPARAPPPSNPAVAPSPGPTFYRFDVGDDAGWARPTSLTFYNEWADRYAPLYVETDFLFFIYDNTTHNVVVLASADYNTCTTSNRLPTFSSGVDPLRPRDAGVYSFSSSGPGDCAAGMRFQIQYIAGARPAVPEGPPTPSSPPPSPQLLPPPLARPPLSVPPSSSVPPAQPPLPPLVPPTEQPPSPSILPPPPQEEPTAAPPSPTVAAPPLPARPPPPPPPPPRTPPPPGLNIPPLPFPPGATLPPGLVPPPPGPSAALPGATASSFVLLVTLGLSLFLLS